MSPRAFFFGRLCLTSLSDRAADAPVVLLVLEKPELEEPAESISPVFQKKLIVLVFPFFVLSNLHFR